MRSKRYYQVRKAVRILFGLIVAGVFLVALGVAGHNDLVNSLPACPTEDSDNCYWDGGDNGVGSKFYVIDGEVTYVR